MRERLLGLLRLRSLHQLLMLGGLWFVVLVDFCEGGECEVLFAMSFPSKGEWKSKVSFVEAGMSYFHISTLTRRL